MALHKDTTGVNAVKCRVSTSAMQSITPHMQPYCYYARSELQCTAMIPCFFLNYGLVMHALQFPFICVRNRLHYLFQKSNKKWYFLSATIRLTFYIMLYCSCIKTPIDYASSVASETTTNCNNKHENLGLVSSHYNTDYSYLHWWRWTWHTWQVVDIHIFIIVILFTIGDICMTWVVFEFISTQ